MDGRSVLGREGDERMRWIGDYEVATVKCVNCKWCPTESDLVKTRQGTFYYCGVQDLLLDKRDLECETDCGCFEAKEGMG